MGYSYEAEKQQLFTDKGQVQFLKIRDQVNRILKEAGAVRCQEALGMMTGSSWEHLACLDRMVELGELVCIGPDNAPTQYKVYVGPH